MAKSAQGIDAAFNRIADKDYLKSLRTATKGLVNDMELMKAAVRAENFNIPLSQLGRLLEFAQQRAKDTGESVDYLVNSIVTGIGRKSPLILDNLGISAIKLNEEFKKTGDFTSAVAVIVEEEMSKVGKAVDTATEAATRKKVAWENLQLELGKRFLGLSTGWSKVSSSIAEGLTNIIEKSKSAVEVYDDQVKKVADLEVNTGSLTKRYEELTSKINLNKSEQAELNRIMNTISSTIPGVVTEFDKYGNVLSINTQKVWAFIAAEKEKLKYMNREALKESQKDLKDLERQLQGVNNMISGGITSSSVGGSITGFVQTVTRQLTDVELEELNKEKQF